MCYSGPMGYGMQFPAHRVAGSIWLWHIRGYGCSGLCVMGVLLYIGIGYRLSTTATTSVEGFFAERYASQGRLIFEILEL